MSIPSELGHLTVPTNLLPMEKTSLLKRVSNPGPLDPEFYALQLRHTGSTQEQEALVDEDKTTNSRLH